MTITMTLEEYLELQNAQDTLQQVITAAHDCITSQQSRYSRNAEQEHLLKCIAEQRWDDI